MIFGLIVADVTFTALAIGLVMLERLAAVMTAAFDTGFGSLATVTLTELNRLLETPDSETFGTTNVSCPLFRL